MHREVGAAVGERELELLDEESLAADLGERLILHAIALCGDAEQLHRHARVERANRARTCSACHSASADSRVAIVRRRIGAALTSRSRSRPRCDGARGKPL
jgi:hypothetical protein